MNKKKRYVFSIYEPSDFNKLRNLDNNGETVLVNIKQDIDFADIDFDPINGIGVDVIIDGKNHTISNLSIDKEDKIEVGLFSKVNSIQVKNLNMLNFNIIGCGNVGSLVGRVEHDAFINGSTFSGNVNAESHCGGILGSVDKLVMCDSCVATNVSGIDVVGGVVGLSDSVLSYDNHFNNKLVAKGKAVGEVSGYIAENEKDRIKHLAYVALQQLQSKPTVEEDEIIRLIKKDY
jgi:hypothetical protein